MINQLREKIFAWQLKRQAPRTIQLPHWKKVRTVALLYPDNNAQDIVQLIEKADKEVVLFTLPKKEQICSLTLAPKTEVINQLRARHFDLLIDLTQTPNLSIQYMAMYIKADFKTGKLARTSIYDLSIDTHSQESPVYLYSQIIKYLQMFAGE